MTTRRELRWSVATLDALRLEVGVRPLVQEPAEALAQLRLKLAGMGNPSERSHRITRVAHILEMLRINARHGGLAQREFEGLVATVQALLTVEGIEPYTSKLGHLHGELQVRKSQQQLKTGHHHEAALLSLMGELMSRRASSEEAALERLESHAEALFRLGFARMAIEAFSYLAGADMDSERKVSAQISLVSAQRLAGDPRAASGTIASFAGSVSSHMLAGLSWNQAMLDFAASGDPKRIFELTQPGAPCHSARYLIDASLIAKAVPSKAFLEVPLRPRTIKRKFQNDGDPGREINLALACLEHVEDLYDGTLPVERRIDRVNEALSRRKSLAGIERELLLLAACVRGFQRTNQIALGSFFLAEYRSLCLTLSEGRTADAFNLLADLKTRGWTQRESRVRESDRPGFFGRLAQAVEARQAKSKFTAGLGGLLLLLEDPPTKAFEGSLPLPDLTKLAFRTPKGVEGVLQDLRRSTIAQSYASVDPVPVIQSLTACVFRVILTDGRHGLAMARDPEHELRVADWKAQVVAMRPFLAEAWRDVDFDELLGHFAAWLQSEADFKLKAARQLAWAEGLRDGALVATVPLLSLCDPAVMTFALPSRCVAVADRLSSAEWTALSAALARNDHALYFPQRAIVRLEDGSAQAFDLGQGLGLPPKGSTLAGVVASMRELFAGFDAGTPVEAWLAALDGVAKLAIEEPTAVPWAFSHWNRAKLVAASGVTDDEELATNLAAQGRTA